MAGDLLHVRLLGQHFIILNSEKMARALLDQRSALYSDRLVVRAYSMYGIPFLINTRLTASFRFGVDYSTALMPYGDEWRLHRKIFQHAFRAESEARHQEIYLRNVRTLLADLLDAPAEFGMHIKRSEMGVLSFPILMTLSSYVAWNIMALAYGYETTVKDDPLVKRMMSHADLLAKELSPERCAILSAFPFRTSHDLAFVDCVSPPRPVEKLPGWLPGSELWRNIGYIRKLSTQTRDDPFDWVKEQMVISRTLASRIHVTDYSSRWPGLHPRRWWPIAWPSWIQKMITVRKSTPSNRQRRPYLLVSVVSSRLVLF